MELGNAKDMLNSLFSMSSEIKKSKHYDRKNKVTNVCKQRKSVELTVGPPRQSVRPLALPRAPDKLPSTISCPYNLTEFHLDSISPSIVSIALEDAMIAEQVQDSITADC